MTENSNQKNSMDSEPSSEKFLEKEESFENFYVSASDVLQSAWIRRTFRGSDELDRFLLGYGRYFLLPFGSILWCLLVAFAF
jgi:hypothetical protein